MPVATPSHNHHSKTPKKTLSSFALFMPIATPSHNHNPCGHKKGEGSSRAFTQSKKPCPRNNRLLLGIPFAKNNAVILSTFYARCIAKQQPQSQPGIKRVKDLAELLRRPKSHAQATIACCLASILQKKIPVSTRRPGFFLTK